MVFRSWIKSPGIFPLKKTKQRKRGGNFHVVMGKKLAILHVFLLGTLTLCNGTPLEGESSSTSASASASVSAATREISSTSFANPASGRKIAAEERISAITEEMPTSVSFTESVEENFGKFQKAKMKVLNSNRKNSSEKIVLQSEKPEIKSGISESAENAGNVGSENYSEIPTAESSERATESPGEGSGNRQKPGGDDQKGKKVGFAEGRSLKNGSSRDNVDSDLKKETKIHSSTTERTTTNSFTSESVQINHLSDSNSDDSNNNNNGQGHDRSDGKIVRPSTQAISPNKKSTQISKTDSLKNEIRFDPTGQTDRVSVVPDLGKPSSDDSREWVKRIGATNSSEEAIKTDESIAFPSDGGDHSDKESKAYPVLREVEIEKETERVEEVSEDKSPPVRFDQGKVPAKFRAQTKQKLPEVKKHQKETNPKRNFSLDNSEVEISGTEASWTLATLRSSTSAKSTEKPSETSPNQDEKVAKEQNQELKNTIPDTNPADAGLPAGKRNSSSPTDFWSPVKTVQDDTDLVVPESVDSGQVGMGSTPFLQVIKASTPEMAGTATTESPQKPVTTPRASKDTTETSSETGQDRTIIANGKESLPPVTTSSGRAEDDDGMSGVTEAPTVTFIRTTSTDGVAFSTSSKSDSSEEDGGETLSEVELKTFLEQEKKEGSQNVSTVRLPVTFSAAQSNSLDSNATTTEFTFEPTDANVAVTAFPPVNVSASLSPDVGTIATETPSKTTSDGSPAEEIPPVPTQSSSTSPSSTTPAPTTPKTPAPMEITAASTSVTWAATATGSPTERTTTEKFSATSNQTTSPTSTSTRTTPSASEILFNPRTTTASPEPETKAASTSKASASTTVLPESTVKFEVAAKPETTEESIYYKNYISTTINPHEEITEENVPAYLRLTVQATSWAELCALKESLRDSILNMLNGKKNVSSEFVHFLNLNDRNCREKTRESGGGGTEENGSVFLPVNMFLMDKNGDFDKNLSEAFLTLWGRHGLDFELPIRKVDFVTPIVNLTELTDSSLGGSVVAAIVISCVAGICVILLGILFVIMKRRQKRFNYGQRCTPVSLDAYSLDSVSIYNSVRRKGHGASKRSYGNAAFDDPEVPTHPVNFAGLANFSSRKEQLHEEFAVIPQVYPKAEELPEGAETKNRYANVIPLPETRVHLTLKDGDPLSDYINANYVRGNKGADKLYIATQGPMQSTVEDFWRMVWEQQCKVILMITDLQENGVEKCADYLPPNEVTDNLRLFGDFQVTLKKRDVKEKYITSNLTLKNMETNLWREVTHLWYLGWPSQGVPAEANSLIAFLIEARSQMKIQNGAKTTSPAVVHCSPGTGRTGTVIACDLCIREYEQTRMVDIPKCVFNLRRHRAGAVQTKDQYAFIYQVLNVYATKLTGGGIESI